ncbi:MAG TPA: ATP-binding protein [Gammaproteobacteria bacterium]|nr:ATP-binding protein [Gammaproteobacteria bacterium]
MLVEFKVTNYRSFQEPAVLSMVASKDDTFENSNCLEANPRLLRSAVLYGANASGKSNLIFALAFMKNMVEASATQLREGQPLNIAPFRFNAATLSQPSELETTFIDNGIRYEYGFAANATRIVKEWLIVYKTAKPQCWFEREYNESENKDNWYFGPHLLESHRHQIWQESTRTNALFLSTAVNLNSEQLRPIYKWFAEQLIVLPFPNIPISPEITLEHLQKNKKSKIIDFLQAADLGIKDVHIEMQKRKQVQVQWKFQPGTEHQFITEPEKEIDIPIITFIHHGKNNQAVAFDIGEESHGTQRLFSYAGFFLEILSKGKTLIIDELDSSLHTKMVGFLIKLMHNSKHNQNNAQLIFSTHNTSLLDTNELFRRDQIWFIEKNIEQASQLYPLTDFSPRKGEAIEKGYLMGRYGALPFFDFFE